jgi:hypothetical protein
VTVRTRLAAGLGTAVLLLTGCGGGGAGDTDAGTGAAPTVLRAATLGPGDPLPTAAGTPLFTLTGRLRAGRPLVVDRQVLAGLAQVQLRTYEPWVKKDLTFRGVWLADLLAAAGAGPDASVQVTALDDYAVTLSAADLREGSVLLATGDGAGAVLPVDDGGPTRIVFGGGSRAGGNADQWIWSLRTIDVR